MMVNKMRVLRLEWEAMYQLHCSHVDKLDALFNWQDTVWRGDRVYSKYTP